MRPTAIALLIFGCGSRTPLAEPPPPDAGHTLPSDAAEGDSMIADCWHCGNAGLGFAFAEDRCAGVGYSCQAPEWRAHCAGRGVFCSCGPCDQEAGVTWRLDDP